MTRKYLFSVIAFLFLFSLHSSNSSIPRKLVKRQGPAFLAADLLPPPALSASFPTLRPRNPNHALRAEQPPRDLVPPPIKSPPNPRPFTSNNKIAPQPTSTEFPLLPPLEIPPERPLTDAEIQETIKGVQDTSFIPTTGQGISQLSKTTDLTLSQPAHNPPPTVNNVVIDNTNSSSNIRFPNESTASPLPSNCPICECTSEIDYICASNGVLYLNSCSFDCATFCHTGLKKVPLEECASHNVTK